VFVSISQVIGCKDRVRNDLLSGGVKLFLHSNLNAHSQKMWILSQLPGS